MIGNDAAVEIEAVIEGTTSYGDGLYQVEKNYILVSDKRQGKVVENYIFKGQRIEIYAGREIQMVMKYQPESGRQ